MRASEITAEVEALLERDGDAVETAAAEFATAMLATVRMRHRSTRSTLAAAFLFEQLDDARAGMVFPHPAGSAAPSAEVLAAAERQADATVRRAWTQNAAHKRLRKLAGDRLQRLVALSREGAAQVAALMAQIDSIVMVKSNPGE